MFKKYYQQQLVLLRERAAEFAHAHPSIAPLLGKTSADPDVERLLEGTAFLTGLVHQKLDDDFPEIVHSLTDTVFPHLLRPIPSTSIVTFTPKESLLEPLPVAAGTLLASKPIEGTSCLFKTTMDVEILPMHVKEVKRNRFSTSEEAITVTVQLHGIDLEQLPLDSIRFYLGGSFSEAATIFMALQTILQRIQIRVPHASSVVMTLPPTHVHTPGFDLNNTLFTTPNNAFCGYTLFTEYFLLPQKFLFIEVSGLKQLQTAKSHSSFDIEFILESNDKIPEQIKPEHFTLFATPVVNLFSHDAEPTTVDNFSEKLLIRPAYKNKDHYSIYSIDSVTGFGQGTVQRRNYVPLNQFSTNNTNTVGVYQIYRSNSIVDNSQEIYLSLAFKDGTPPRREILSIELTCTNNHVPENLRIGDICEATSHSPELADFRNVIAPTPQIDMVSGNNLIWRFLSHVSLNYLPCASAESLRELLRLYIFEQQRSDQRVGANIKRVEAISGFTSRPVERLVRGAMMRGVKLQLTAAAQNFASTGDQYLFASVLDRFMALYVSINTFSQFELINSQSGEVFQWKPRLGEKPLL